MKPVKSPRRIRAAENCCRALRCYIADRDPEGFRRAVDWCIYWLSLGGKDKYAMPPKRRRYQRPGDQP